MDELLKLGAEHVELDFKATRDLACAAHRLGLVMDLVAIANTGMGGSSSEWNAHGFDDYLERFVTGEN